MTSTDALIDEATEITIKDILVVRNELRKLSTGWAKKLAEKMYPDVEIAVGRERVYNIISGSTRNPEVRNIFIKYSLELKNELLAGASATRNAINTIVNQ